MVSLLRAEIRVEFFLRFPVIHETLTFRDFIGPLGYLKDI